MALSHILLFPIHTTWQFGVDDPRPLHERVHEVAFNSERKYMEVSVVLYVCMRMSV